MGFITFTPHESDHSRFPPNLITPVPRSLISKLSTVSVCVSLCKTGNYTHGTTNAHRGQRQLVEAVLTTVLNMSSESVQKWEQGKTKPQGAALRLLNIIDEKGITAVI